MTGPSDFLQRLFAEIGTVPLRGLLQLAIMGAVTAAYEVFFWTGGSDFATVDLFLSLGLVLGWLVVSYTVAMSLMEAPATLAGGAKFIAASIVIMSPALLLLGVLLTSASLGFPAGALLAVALIVPVIGLTALLAGWPVA